MVGTAVRGRRRLATGHLGNNWKTMHGHGSRPTATPGRLSNTPVVHGAAVTPAVAGAGQAAGSGALPLPGARRCAAAAVCDRRQCTGGRRCRGHSLRASACRQGSAGTWGLIKPESSKQAWQAESKRCGDASGAVAVGGPAHLPAAPRAWAGLPRGCHPGCSPVCSSPTA